MGNKPIGCKIDVQVAKKNEFDTYYDRTKKEKEWMIQSYSLETNFSCYLKLKMGNKRVKISTSAHEDNYIILLKLMFNKEQKNIEVSPPENLKISFFRKHKEQIDYNRFWRICTSSNEDELTCGDLVQFGNKRFLIREILTESSNIKYTEAPPKDIEDSLIEESGVFNMGEAAEGEIIIGKPCEVCGMDEFVSDQKGPLIKICDCINSSIFHRNCFFQFIKTLINIETTHDCKYFKGENLMCESCRKEYPQKIVINKKSQRLVSFDNFRSFPFIVFEMMDTLRGTYEAFLIHFQNLKKPLTIGSSNRNGVTLDYKQMDETHASVRYDALKSEYYIKDNNSRFGTFVNKYGPMQLNSKQKKIRLLIHDHLITLNYLKKSSKSVEGMKDLVPEESGFLVVNNKNYKSFVEEKFSHVNVKVTAIESDPKKVQRTGLKKPSRKLKV